MTATYDREQQLQDLAVVTAAQNELSALVAGERSGALKPFCEDFARIAMYFDGLQRRMVARMFWALATKPKVCGFETIEYARLLPIVQKHIKAKLIRRRRKDKTCREPEKHRQPCFCLKLAQAQHIQNERESFSTVGQGASAPILPYNTEGRVAR